MTTHVAILHPRYIDRILAGAKTIEARLSANRIAPFALVQPGDTLYLRPTGAPYAARATIARVWSFENLRPSDIRELRKEFAQRIDADAGFWRTKRSARYATLLELTGVRRSRTGPVLVRKAGDRRAWFVLDKPIRRAA